VNKKKFTPELKKLAKEAGFVLWKDEEWNPGDVVDWGSRYDDELVKFAKLIAKECARVSLDSAENQHRLYKMFLNQFGIKK
jgi:hypothetical protein